ncbi:C-type lectin domain family 4 member G-like isoform X2 [Dasypus novemcinctus]|uniref:C-type lectin domain family 4 member G-like isoform X2 n=1 Tax=Dasypus novemcinctus TaxID=9361 RepID=UPI00265FF557|nr:C-type lectin domain family 4 member G-like isoform X2 [Dasypus novemcinctus]
MAEGRRSGWQHAQDLTLMGEKSLSILKKSGQQDQNPPDTDPWKFLCLAMTMLMFLLVMIVGVLLRNVVLLNYQLEEELHQLNNTFTRGLADARYNRDIFRGEMFRQMNAVQSENGSSCTPCPEDWTAFEGSCYKFSTEALTWFEAKDQCIHEGAHLVIINSLVEQEFLTTSQHVFWIGLQKNYWMGTYKWQDGSSPTYTNWSSEQLHFLDCVFIKPPGHWFKNPLIRVLSTKS